MLSLFEPKIKYSPGDSLFIFTSIFAPADLKKKVNHHWQWFNGKTENWETMDRIIFEIQGGREQGYRGYTYKQNIVEGKWKVDVITSDNMILGRINFTVIADSLNKKNNLKTDIY